MSKSFKDIFRQEQPEKLSSQAIRYSQQRLTTIEHIMQAMKTRNKQFLKSYELTQKWNLINEGLMLNGRTTHLPNIVQFKACAAIKWQRSFFNPFIKKPITMCYNKFNDLQKFSTQLTYNMILYHDSVTNRELNWNNIEQAIVTTVRGLHLAGLCKKSDKKCFAQELKKRVYEKQRFKGMVVQNEASLIEKAVRDTVPITQSRVYTTDDIFEQ